MSIEGDRGVVLGIDEQGEIRLLGAQGPCRRIPEEQAAKP